MFTMPKDSETRYVLQKLLASISYSDDCCLSNIPVNNKGYAFIGWRGKPRAVHRLMYGFWYHVDPKNLHVLHKCDNRTCCRPDHLFLGTNQDNIKDKVLKERQNKALTWAQAEELRALYKQGKFTQTKLGEKFGIDQTTVSKIILRKSYATAPLHTTTI